MEEDIVETKLDNYIFLIVETGWWVHNDSLCYYISKQNKETKSKTKAVWTLE